MHSLLPLVARAVRAVAAERDQRPRRRHERVAARVLGVHAVLDRARRVGERKPGKAARRGVAEPAVVRVQRVEARRAGVGGVEKVGRRPAVGALLAAARAGGVDRADVRREVALKDVALLGAVLQIVAMAEDCFGGMMMICIMMRWVWVGLGFA